MTDDDRHIRTAGGISIPASEIEIHFVRARGPGGQKVNKTSSAARLRFDIRRSSAFTEAQRRRLLASNDSRLTASGAIVIRSQSSRSRESNRREAIGRLIDFVDQGLQEQKPRIPTRPGPAAVRRRLDEKAQRARLKASRRKPDE